MAAAAAWRAARQKTAAALLTTAPTERFEAFVRNWAESDDEPYAARAKRYGPAATTLISLSARRGRGRRGPMS